MATQGLLTIMKDNKVKYKIIAGCNGFNIDKVKEKILMTEPHILFSSSELVISILLHTGAILLNFGCKDCLVVISEYGGYYQFKEPLSSLYGETFNQPEFNPRWEYGTADYVEVLKF